MSSDQNRLMTKSEIAERLGVSADDVQMWAQAFPEWLDVDATWKDKEHDDNDFRIFTFISERIEKNVPFGQRIHLIRRELESCSTARSIWDKRQRPEVARWRVVQIAKYMYEWLEPLQPYVDSIADFGCWDTASEAIALLWILKAKRVVVVDREQEYIRNAKEWLETTRAKHPYFKEYEPEFIVGDMTKDELKDELHECDFDLSYCQDVLYNMKDNLEGLQSAIYEMARVAKPGGWVIAVEPKIPEDISESFENAGLVRDNRLQDAPGGTYCYRKNREKPF